MNFNEYMMSFYGPKGVYPMDFNETIIALATGLYKMRLPEGREFLGDSIDREGVRDVILAIREQVRQEKAAA